MKQQEAEVLARVGAIKEAHIVRNDMGKGWFVFLWGEGGNSVSDCDAVETARGSRQMRAWASIDSAYAWVQDLPHGQMIRVSVSGRVG